MKANIFASIQLTDQEKQILQKEKAVFEKQITEREAMVENKANGFFGPDSMTWMIYREPSLLFGGISALHLQIAHPSVAQGVKMFSNFHREYLYRAQRTFAAMSGFYFGDTALALKSARHLFKMHSMIRGSMQRNINGTLQTVPFCAKDPELLCWVLATLVDTSITIFELMHRPLSEKEKTQFFEESKTIAILMGIPLDQYPENLQAFYHYYHIMIHGNQLAIRQTALDLSKIILHPPYGSHRLLRWSGMALLPTHLAQAYQLDWTKREKSIYQKLIRTLKFLLKYMPKAVRYAPPYHQASYRIKKANGHKGIHLGGLYDWLAKTMGFPFCIQPAS